MENEELLGLDNAPVNPASGNAGNAPDNQDDDFEDFDVDGEDQGEQGEEGADGEGGEPEFEEIEYAGKRYAIPKELKDGFMMQADYTRKTQELAEARRELEDRQQAHEQETEESNQSRMDSANLKNIDAAIAQYQQVDWARYQQEDPAAAEGHWRQFQTLQGQRQQLADKITRSEKQRTEQAQRQHAERIEATQQTLQRDIKGWGPDLARKLTQFGLAQGYTQEQLIALNTDARAIKVLHKAYQADQLLTRQKTGSASPQATPIKPLETVGARRSRPPASAQPSDRDSDDAWMRKREAQLRKRNRP